MPRRGGWRMSPFGAHQIVSCWQGQKRLNEGIFVTLSHDSGELKIANFLVPQMPAHTGAPHLFPGNKPSNFFFVCVCVSLSSVA